MELKTENVRVRRSVDDAARFTINQKYRREENNAKKVKNKKIKIYYSLQHRDAAMTAYVYYIIFFESPSAQNRTASELLLLQWGRKKVYIAFRPIIVTLYFIKCVINRPVASPPPPL